MAINNNAGAPPVFRPQPPLPPTPQEQKDIQMLVDMFGTESSEDDILRLLRTNNGNIEKTASVLLEGSGAVAAMLGPSSTEPVIPRTPPPSKPERGSPAQPIIDLTGDTDDEFTRALAMSLEDQGPTFRPSDRAPDPNWAVVPSNVEVNAGGLSQEDQQINRAIEASLTYETVETFDELPVHERVRDGDTPITLRPTQASFVYTGLILQGLFFVPQVKHAVARYRPAQSEDLNDPAVMRKGPDKWMWSLLELFANMDLARISELSIDECLEVFTAAPWKNPAESPGDLAFQFYSDLTWELEAVLNRDELTLALQSWPRLFHFRYGFSDAEPVHVPLDKRYDMSIVRVSVPGTPDANDLLSCLALELNMGSSELSKQQVIFDPSAVVAFQLNRTHVSSGGKSERSIFGYPKHVFLDQFLKQNAEIALEKRRLQRDLLAEIEVLKKRREGLIKHKDRDVLADLRSAVHYYEDIAVDDQNDAPRKATVHDAALKLRKILTKVENELQTINNTIKKYQTQASSVFDCPELQEHRYDLRVVLVHDGLFGRTRVYSYIQQGEQWWKSLDYHVTKVSEETVFSDSVGLHLNAGPFMLIYSLAVSPEDENAIAQYPVPLKDTVKNNNLTFYESLPAGARERFSNPNSPPSTPVVPVSQVPSLSSSIAEPSDSPRVQTMDVD
ncbi:hypothetical protein EIP91_000221 [Steccherinum ochraceum]|uniref:USP domain-containing protein n=1 Tax=Steccherinum ochraceum TaxID=92696 RepID=A0A4R0RWS9_9APHY|nr:hypothetical protein EIP91_000221 [Steccherinum ochraceum]